VTVMYITAGIVFTYSIKTRMEEIIFNAASLKLLIIIILIICTMVLTYLKVVWFKSKPWH
jgi:hypothetical protein